MPQRTASPALFAPTMALLGVIAVLTTFRSPHLYVQILGVLVAIVFIAAAGAFIGITVRQAKRRAAAHDHPPEPGIAPDPQP